VRGVEGLKDLIINRSSHLGLLVRVPSDLTWLALTHQKPIGSSRQHSRACSNLPVSGWVGPAQSSLQPRRTFR